MSSFDTKYGSFGSNWGQYQAQPQGYSMDSPMPLQKQQQQYSSTAIDPSSYNYTNAIDLASDGYANGGVGNLSGLSYGQSMGGGAAPAAGGMFSGLSQWGKDSGFLGSLDTKTGIKTDGWGGAAIGAGTAIFNAYMGMKQYGLAKEQFKFNKDMTTRNFNAQADQVNAQYKDRDAARQASGQASNFDAYNVKKI